MPEEIMTVGENITPVTDKKVLGDLEFLVWPEFTIVQRDLGKSIHRYRNLIRCNLEKIDTLKDWGSEEVTNLVKARFKEQKNQAQKLLRNANMYGNDEEKRNLEVLIDRLNHQIANWKPEMNVELARMLYEKVIQLVTKYALAYDDLIAHKKSCANRKLQLAKATFEKMNEYNMEGDVFLREFHDKLQELDSNKETQTSKISEFFDEMFFFIAISLGISCRNQTRLKSWSHFMEKLHNRAESLDLGELDYYNDIYGTMFVVNSTDNVVQDIENCYIILNQICKWMTNYRKAQILKPKFIGTASEYVYPEYAAFVKDYFRNPKSTGYQALHVCFWVEIEMQNGEKRAIKFEVQIVTSDLKLIANNPKAHSAYKKMRKQLNWDLTKIKTEGFAYNGEGEYIDYDGFIDAIPLNSRRDC